MGIESIKKHITQNEPLAYAFTAKNMLSSAIIQKLSDVLLQNIQTTFLVRKVLS